MPHGPYRALVITGPFSTEDIRTISNLIQAIEARDPDGGYGLLCKRLEGKSNSYEELYGFAKEVLGDALPPPGPTIVLHPNEDKD